MDLSLELPNESMNAPVSLSLQSASQETVSFLASPSMSHHLVHVCLCFKVPSTNNTTNIQQRRVLKRNKQKQVASKETCRNCKTFLFSTSRRQSNIQGWCLNCFRLIKEIEWSKSLLAASDRKVVNLKVKLNNSKKKISRTILKLKVECFINLINQTYKTYMSSLYIGV